MNESKNNDAGCAVPNTNYHGLYKVDLITQMVFTFITLGLYHPVWFLRRRRALNSLGSEKKMRRGIFIFQIIIFTASVSITLITAIISIIIGSIARTSLMKLIVFGIKSGFAAACYFNIIAASIFVLVSIIQCFKVKRILEDHVDIIKKCGFSFSKFATFFFQIYYLQYKINRL